MLTCRHFAGDGALENLLVTHWSLGPATLTRASSPLHSPTQARHKYNMYLSSLVTLNIDGSYDAPSSSRVDPRHCSCHATFDKHQMHRLYILKYHPFVPDRHQPPSSIERSLAWSRLPSMWELETSKPVGVGPDVVLGTGLSIQPSSMPASMTRAVHHADRDNPEQSFQPGSPRPPLWIKRPTSKWLEMDGREESIRVLPLIGGRVLPIPVSFSLNKQSSTPYTRVWIRRRLAANPTFYMGFTCLLSWTNTNTARATLRLGPTVFWILYLSLTTEG